MFDEFIKPLIVLTVICLFFSAALALVNSFTEPVIAQAADERAWEAMYEIMPDATGFETISLEDNENIPLTVKEAYKSKNNIGYVFIAAVKGYGGDINIMCAIDETGNIITVKTLSHTETAGIGTVLEEDSFLGQFRGATAALSGVDTITGATVSTSAFIRAVSDVFAVFEKVGGTK